MDLLDFLLIALSTWRLASLLVNEEGPFHIFEKLRDRVIPEGEVTGFLPGLFSCMWCMSLYTGAVCLGIWAISDIPLIILSASAVSVVVERYVG